MEHVGMLSTSFGDCGDCGDNVSISAINCIVGSVSNSGNGSAVNCVNGSVGDTVGINAVNCVVGSVGDSVATGCRDNIIPARDGPTAVGRGHPSLDPTPSGQCPAASNAVMMPSVL